MWGGTDEAQSTSTIRSALDHGINVIDTAPVYGFGRSEEIVGKALAEGQLRSRVVMQDRARMGERHGIPQCQPCAHPARDRGLAAPAPN